VCDVILKIHLQRKVNGSSEVEGVKTISYTFSFLLSTISDEFNQMEEGALKVNKVTPGTVILHSHDSSSILSTNR
jgi:hypothetical protein